MTNSKEYIASLPDRSEVRSWERKCVTMQRLLDELAPIEEQMFEIMRERLPLVNQIEDLRFQMTQECIHPVEHLVEKDDHVICKFCDRRLVITAKNE